MKLLLALSTVLLLTGCQAPAKDPGLGGLLPNAKQAPRPACADKFAAAFTSGKVVPGAFSCVVMNLGPALSAQGINSDDQWAAANRSNGRNQWPPFHFETTLRGGAYVYRADLKLSGNTAVAVDLLIWLGAEGSVMNFDLVSRFD